jgi:hypothetical protein
MRFLRILNPWFSDKPKRFIIGITNKEVFGISEIKKAIGLFSEMAEAINSNSCFGFWKNGNKLFLDFNISSNDESEARILARAFSQKAVWDSELHNEITI